MHDHTNHALTKYDDNWLPRWYSILMVSITLLSLLVVLALALSWVPLPIWLHWGLMTVFVLLFLVGLFFSGWAVYARREFSYNRHNSVSRRVIDWVSDQVQVSKNAKILDVGCGSGGLTIACAKKNPQSHVLGIDRWGAEFGHYSKAMCYDKAIRENVQNVEFLQADACELPFDDETFDALISNYVYHNIVGKDKQGLLLESFRVLKKGGVFAIHDLMSPRRYGDMQAFIKKLEALGFVKVELTATDGPPLMTKGEATALRLKGSALLHGIK